MTYPIQEDVEVWHRMVAYICRMSDTILNHLDIDSDWMLPNLKQFQDFREYFFLEHAEDLPRAQFQNIPIIRIMNIQRPVASHAAQGLHHVGGVWGVSGECPQQSAPFESGAGLSG